MRDYSVDIQSLLSDNLSLDVYRDVIPESVPLPACLWFNLGYSQERVVSGVKVDGKVSYRVILVTESGADSDKHTEDILRLDNIIVAPFERVQCSLNSIEAREIGSDIRRSLFDLDVYI